MSELLNSIKTDLLDRRLLPLVALVAFALAGAIAYVALGGSSSPVAPAPIAAVTPAIQSGGLQVTSTTADRAVAETTDGAKEQRSGTARNPFALLPGANAQANSAAAGPTTTSKSSNAPAPSGTGSAAKPGPSSGTEPSAPAHPEPSKPEPSKPEAVKPAKPKNAGYHVAVLFGPYPAGATPENVTLTPYENLKLQAPLPAAKGALIVFRGVTAGGKSATFTLLGEAILHGTGACLPNPAQCQAIDLKPGQTEQLEYVNAAGEVTVYELRVVGVTPAKASKASKAAKASAAQNGWPESKIGRELLLHSGLFALPDLHYSSQPGVLVFASRRAVSARAHDAVQLLLGWP